MKLLTLFAATALMLSAQSNPSWWKYAPPEASALVGIHWKEAKSTFLATAIAAELAPTGSLGFPNVELLRNPDQILIGSPLTLAIEYGTFPQTKLRTQASAAGLRRVIFKGVEIWTAMDPTQMSIAWVNEKLVLVGNSKALEAAIARIANPKSRVYSPLLARAARYSKEDMWVVAAQLPDPLASVFLPLQVDATAFEGSISAWDGLHLVAAVERTTPNRALDLADQWAEQLAARPSMAEGTEIATRDRSVLIRMDLDEAQLAATLRNPGPMLVSTAEPTVPEAPQVVAAAPVKLPPAAPKSEPRAFVAPAALPPAAKSVAALGAVPALSSSTTQSLVPASFSAPLPPAPPKTVRILGLESGTREVPLGQ